MRGRKVSEPVEDPAVFTGDGESHRSAEWRASARLALLDMGARVRGVPAEDASAFNFFEWTQQAGGAVSNCATTSALLCCVSALHYGPYMRLV